MTLKDLGMPSPYEEIKELREKLEIAKNTLEKVDSIISFYCVTIYDLRDLPISKEIKEALKKLGEK